MARTWSGRYNPGLEWTMPGAWPQNIVNTLIQAQHDVPKGHTRWKHSKLREELEKDFPKYRISRTPEDRANLSKLIKDFRKDFPVEEGSNRRAFINEKILKNKESIQPIPTSKIENQLKLGERLEFSRPSPIIPPTNEELAFTYGALPGGGTLGKVPPGFNYDKVNNLKGNTQTIKSKAVDPTHIETLKEKGVVKEGSSSIVPGVKNVRPASTSGLRWNEGVGRWTAPRNSGRLMRANLELRNQPTQIQKPIADEVGDGIPGFASSWGGKTYGNMDLWAGPTNLGIDKSLNLSSLGAPAAATKFAAGMSSPNYIASAFSPTAASLGQAAGQTALTTGGMTGITSGASAAGMAKGPLLSLGINAAKAILARVLAGDGNATHHSPYYQPGIGQQDEPWTTQFYTGGSWR